MKKNRANYLYQFQGKILTRRLAKASPNSKYANQTYYVLTILQKDHTKKSVQVFPSKLASPKIWTSIEQSQCFGSPYEFYCKNQKGYYYLVDWEKTQSFNQKKPSPKPNHHDLN